MNPPVPPADRGRAGWTEPLPRRIPPPTWSPFGLAFGIVLLGLGLLTNRVVLGMGAAVAIAAAAAWIRELRHDLQTP